MSPERRQALSEGQKRAWADPEIRAKRTAAIKAAWDDPLTRALQMRSRLAGRRRSREATNAYFREYKRLRKLKKAEAAAHAHIYIMSGTNRERNGHKT